MPSGWSQIHLCTKHLTFCCRYRGGAGGALRVKEGRGERIKTASESRGHEKEINTD